MNDQKSPVLMSSTRIFSKKVSRADADDTSKKFIGFLAKEHDLEAMCNDVSAAGVIGTFHWYGIKINLPEKSEPNLMDTLNLRTLRVLEIRNYGAEQDYRAIFIMCNACAELEKVAKGITDFYKNEGYEKCLDLSRVDVDQAAKF